MSINPCVPVPPVRGIVSFDATAFIAQYPQFSTISPVVLGFNFTGATNLLNNSCYSAVKDAPTREYLLYLLVAHITQLLQGSSTQPATGIVGRISEAQQGSVRVRSEYAGTRNTTESEAYYSQTQFGAMFWKMTAQYRTMRYYAPPQRCYGGDLYGYGNGPNPFVGGGFGNGDGSGC